MKRVVKELREWLKQFSDDDEVWAYEGEVQGIIVRHKDKCYTFHNTFEFCPAIFAYPQESSRVDENINEER